MDKIIPTKMIKSEMMMGKFLNGKTMTKILDFITLLQKVVTSKSRKTCDKGNKFDNLLAFLDKLDVMVDNFPPIQQPMRFGNKAFKSWYENFHKEYDTLIVDVIPKETPDLAQELKPYFSEAFGNEKRVDYGTGHELNFLCILLILHEINKYSEEDLRVMVHHVFYKYLMLMRKLQTTYNLEPAGSHGVWGLDDYHFLPFAFGASELINHSEIFPDSIHVDKIVDLYYDDYIYLGCIKFIKSVKKASHFGEHSPLLNDISAVPNWDKVAKGLVKMYIDEVFKKFPIMQHFYFGNYLKYE